MAGRDIVVNDRGTVSFTEDEAGGNKVSLQGPAAIDTDLNIILPNAVPGSSGARINADVSGSDVTLSFVTSAELGGAGMNVLAHASGDGSTDDSAGIRDAIDAAEGSGAAGTATHDRVVFPAGIYRCHGLSSAFEAAKDYCLEGVGMGSTVLRQVNSVDTQIAVVQASRSFVLRNMTIDGKPGTGAATTEILIDITSPVDGYVIIDGVEFRGCEKAIRITGRPKFVAITNCRFVNMTVAGTGPIIDIDGILTGAEDDATILFENNYVEGSVPTTPGHGLTGLDISTNGTGKSARCFIRGNHFDTLGYETQGALKLLHGHDSIIEGNIFSNNIGTAIEVSSSERVRIAGNRIVGEQDSSDAYTTYGISVDGDLLSSAGVSIVDNVIDSDSAITEIGIRVVGDSNGVVTYLQDVLIRGNVVKGCLASLVIDGVKGMVSILNNSFWENYGGAANTYKHNAVYIQDVDGDTQLNITGNVFTGGANSGGAIYCDRSADGLEAAKVDIVLKDNFIDSMGQKSGAGLWLAQPDMATIFISGHATDDNISSFHASGNRYDFTSSQAGTYGMSVDKVKDTVTFASIEDFGAIGDGTVDCTMAINRAGRAALAGGDIFVPSGTFLVSDFGLATVLSTTGGSETGTYIEVTASGQHWHGTGTIHVGATSDNIVFKIGNDYDNVSVKGLTFTETGTNTGDAINVGTNDGTRIDGCTITGFDEGVSSVGTGARITNCRVINATGTGIYAGGGKGVTIANNRIESTDPDGTDGGVFVNGQQSNVTGNTFLNCGGNAIEISTSADNCVVQGNNIDTDSTDTVDLDGHAIYANGSEHLSICANTIENPRDYAASNREDILLNACTNSVVNANAVTSNQVIISATGVNNFLTISNNSLNTTNASAPADLYAIEFSASAIVSSCAITGNVISAADAATSDNSAINLGIGQNNTVTGNHCKNYYTGVNIDAAGSNNTIVGNNFLSVTVNVADAGTGNAYIVNTGDKTTYTQLHATKLGTGTDALGHPAATPLANADKALNVTNSYIEIAGDTGPTYLDKITIDGKETQGGTAESASTSVYNGMLLWIKCSGTNTIHVRGMGVDSSVANSNINIRAANDTLTLDMVGATSLFRFQHNDSNGYWVNMSPGNEIST